MRKSLSIACLKIVTNKIRWAKRKNISKASDFFFLTGSKKKNKTKHGWWTISVEYGTRERERERWEGGGGSVRQTENKERDKGKQRQRPRRNNAAWDSGWQTKKQTNKQTNEQTTGKQSRQTQWKLGVENERWGKEIKKQKLDKNSQPNKIF